MSSPMLDSMINALVRDGFGVSVQRNSHNADHAIIVERMIGGNKLASSAIVTDIEYETGGGDIMVAKAVQHCATQLKLREIEHNGGGKRDDFTRIAELERELERYKEAVKKLSFDLEMSRTPSKAVATEADVRKATLEMAAEFLMDYGVIRTGPELQSVCEQMKKLHPSRAIVMADAAKKMAAGWTQHDPR